MKFHRAFMTAALPLALFASAWATPAGAQGPGDNFVRNYILNRPTVSPYLNLLRQEGIHGVANYQTMVRPQIEQRELARVQEVEAARMQRQITVQQTTIESLRRERAQRVFATGHETRFMNYRDYYPGFRGAGPRR